jgi:hypothetical protein
MAHWLYPANTKFYDVLGAFAEDETYWPMNSKVAVGDVIYVYLAVPHKQIGFVCKVLEIGFDEAAIIDKVRPFFKTPPDAKGKQKPFMKLQTTKALELGLSAKADYAHLKENGLNGMLMGPRKLENNPELLAYIKEIL